MAAKTIRQQILAYLETLMKDMTDPETDDRVWNNVVKENLDDLDAVQLPALGIEEGDEEPTSVMNPCILKTLRVFIEFRFENKIGVDVYDQFNYYLGILQYRLLPDNTVGGFAYDIKEAGNSPRIVDRNDPRPGGVLILDIHYRHRRDNPYVAVNH